MTDPRSQSSRTDTRFTAIDDAVTLLKLLPPVERIAWPLEPGDDELVADALQWLARWAPRASVAFKAHRAEQRRLAREQALQARAQPNGDDS
jgi:hypothetical protein